METWGYCSHCTRWFYVAAEPGRCPVCQADPDKVERRDDAPASTPVQEPEPR